MVPSTTYGTLARDGQKGRHQRKKTINTWSDRRTTYWGDVCLWGCGPEHLLEGLAARYGHTPPSFSLELDRKPVSQGKMMRRVKGCNPVVDWED